MADFKSFRPIFHHDLYYLELWIYLLIATEVI